MKNFTFKYKNIIELLVSIFALILTLITFSHNLTYINAYINFHSLKLEFENIKSHSIGTIFFFLPLGVRNKLHYFYEEYITKIEWGNLLFFVFVTITSNCYTGNPLMHHINILTFTEFIILLLKKNPVEKIHKIIDIISQNFNY